MVENSHWGKMMLEHEKKNLIGSDDVIMMCDLIKSEGLSCDQHQIQTTDGYLLQLFRVKNVNTPAGAKPVFLQHGLFSESSNWAIRGEQSLVNVLANQGYDVWVGNNRGTVYGRENINFNIKDNSNTFFDYSFYDNAMYDTKS